MTQIWALYRQSGSDRLEKQPTDLRRRHHYMRDGTLAKNARRAHEKSQVGLTLCRSGWLPANLFSKQVPETFREHARNLIDQLQLFRFLDHRRQSQRKRLRQLIDAINRAEKKRVGGSAYRRVGGGEETGRRIGGSACRRGGRNGSE